MYCSVAQSARSITNRRLVKWKPIPALTNDSRGFAFNTLIQDLLMTRSWKLFCFWCHGNNLGQLEDFILLMKVENGKNSL